MKVRWNVVGAALVTSVFVLSALSGPVTSSAVALEGAATLASTHFGPIRASSTGASTGRGFDFVSNFEDLRLDGWTLVKGAAPTVGYSDNSNYSGEPTLTSSASAGTQLDSATSHVEANRANLSMQVAINAGASGAGYFGFGTSAHAFVALVGVRDGEVVAGPNPAELASIEAVPTGTAQPPGWVLLLADLTVSGSSSQMQVFVDSTLSVAATVTVPRLSNYAELDLETQHGTVHFSDIIASTYQLATVIPGYNNMEGYGQGSGLLIQKLPEFDNLTANLTLNSWSAPQNNILSWQINAMNNLGTVKSTCVGFFQLGFSIDQHGEITPWYVPGKDCSSTNFVGPTATPAGSVLTLSIIWEQATNQILFRIIDHGIGVTWSHAIPYPSGGGFYGVYTQMEFQPCCNSSSIADYDLSGSLTGIEIVELNGNTELVPASYMVTYLLDAPPSWYLGDYQNAEGGYYQISA